MSAVLAVALLLLLLAGLAAGISSRLSVLGSTVAATLLAIVGFVGAGGWATAHVGLGDWFGFGEAALRADQLSGIFLALVGVTAAAVSAAFVERPPSRFVGAVHALLVLALAVVITVDQAFVFLLGWELVTLSLYLLAAADRERIGSLVSAYFFGTVSKLGGGALLAAFALLAAHSGGSFRFADWAAAAHTFDGATRTAAFVLLLVGFGTKVGLLPFQGPLPVGYAAAPGAASAALSVAWNAGFYGLWRLVFQTIGPASLWWGEVLLIVGGLGALTGILYAIGQDEIKRFLGFSSVEHAGIVLIGFGVALVGQAVHEPKLAAAGLLAATLHVIMHGVGKTLAFLSAERVTVATGRTRMEPLGGLAPLLPRTAVGFGLAALTLAAIPPFGGFVSEWMTLEALLQGFRLHDTLARLLMALAAALLALTAGLALLAFAKLYGSIFLGRARTLLTQVRDPSRYAVGPIVLAVTAAGLGIVAPWEIHWIGLGLYDVLGFDLAHTTITHPLVLGPVYEHFSVLAPTWLAVTLPVFCIATALLVRAVLRPPVRRAPVWLSGTAVEVATAQYTPAAYSNPARVVLRGLYGFSRALSAPRQTRGGGPRRLDTRVVPAFEHYLYAPLTAAALRLSTQARRLQSGNLSAYLLYVLAVLIVSLALIPALR